MKEKKNEETARRLREALLDSGLTQQELADRAGVQKASISQYINGTHVPGNKKAGQMAEVLNCSPIWLMGFDVPKNEDEKQLDISEEKIIKIYRSLSPEKKRMFYDFIKTFVE